MKDLSEMSVAELQQLADEAKSMIGKRQKGEVKAAFDKASKIARELGMSLEELVEAGGKLGTRKVSATRKPVEPRYRNSANADETWTGRGKKPRWLAAALAGGASLDAFLIAK